MIRLVMLGTSASLPSKQYHTSCMAIKYGKSMLFDACEGVQRQLMKYNVSFASIDAVFLSHLHADHFLGLFGLVQSMNLSTRAAELLIYGPKGTAKFFDAVFATKELRPNFPVKFIEIEASAKPFFETELFTITAFPANHGVNALGYALQGRPTRRFDKEKCEEIGINGRMFSELEAGKTVSIGKKKYKYKDVTYEQPGKKIVYSGDSAPNPSLSKACKDADVAVLDSTFANTEIALAKEKRHMTCGQATAIAKKAKVKQLILTHFSNRYDDRSVILMQAKETFENSTLAQEGLEVKL
ncbi:MAG: ribonuclease Z [Candidatus Micrarchaeia archaeon]